MVSPSLIFTTDYMLEKTVMDHTIFFENKGYVYLPNIITTENVDYLLAEFKKLVNEGHSTRDGQCPKSDAINDVNGVFINLLKQLHPTIETMSGKKLYPTYPYGRFYRFGEVLHPHIDREACEISITLNLGSCGEPWPIYVADLCDSSEGEFIKGKPTNFYIKNKTAINLKPGEAVLYKGHEKVHWREEFTGDWHAQIFLHYVDVNGPHANHKYDSVKNPKGVIRFLQ